MKDFTTKAMMILIVCLHGASQTPGIGGTPSQAAFVISRTSVLNSSSTVSLKDS